MMDWVPLPASSGECSGKLISTPLCAEVPYKELIIFMGSVLRLQSLAREYDVSPYKNSENIVNSYNLFKDELQPTILAMVSM